MASIGEEQEILGQTFEFDARNVVLQVSVGYAF
jgi:hypothetical protein